MSDKKQESSIVFPIAIQVSQGDKKVTSGSLDILDKNLDLHGWFSFIPWNAENGTVQLTLGNKTLAEKKIDGYRRDLESISAKLRNTGFTISLRASILSNSEKNEKFSIDFVSNLGQMCAAVDLSSILRSAGPLTKPVKPKSLAQLKTAQDYFQELHLHSYSKDVAIYLNELHTTYDFDIAIAAAYHMLLDRAVDSSGYISNLNTLDSNGSWNEIVNKILFSEEGQSKLKLMSRNLAIIDRKI